MPFIEGFEMPGDAFEAVQVGPDASQQAATAIGQGRFLLSAFAFNSFLMSCGNLLDLLSNTNAALKNGGATSTEGYVSATYYGPDASMRGKKIPVIGAFAEPAESTGQARIWWEALAEMVTRYGQSKIEELATEFDQPGAHRLVDLVGVCGAAAIPQRNITNKTGVRVLPEVARVLPPIYRGAIAFAQRLAAREQNLSFSVVGADETANIALATAVAQIWRDEKKKRALVAVSLMSLPVIGGGAAALIKAVR